MDHPDLKPAPTVRINGVQRVWKANWSLSFLLTELDAVGAGVAVERNGAVVRRADWPHCFLQPGDVLEIVSLVGGG